MSLTAIMWKPKNSRSRKGFANLLSGLINKNPEWISPPRTWRMLPIFSGMLPPSGIKTACLQKVIFERYLKMESTTKQPRLTLVGAGPGDPELITLKGIRALATADVVLYDALISDELLRFAPASAKKVFVGKRAGEHAYTQDQINHLIDDFAIHSIQARLRSGKEWVSTCKPRW